MDAYFEASPTDLALMRITPTPGEAAFVYVTEFDERLDPARLEAAWDETVRRHPILGCRRPQPGEYRWEKALAREPRVASIELEDTECGSRLRLVIDHAAMDGHATLYVLETLRDRYRFRAQTRSVDWTPRNFKDAATPARLSEIRSRHALRQAQARWARMPVSEHVRESAEPQGGPETMRVRFSGEASARVIANAREAGVSVTAVAAGAVAVAWERATREGNQARMSGWLLSNDLRPQLGYTGGIGNISGVDAIWFPVSAGDLPSAVAAADRSHRDLRAAGNFIASQLLAEQSGSFLRLPGVAPLADSTIALAHETARYTRILANMGPFPPALLDWGHARVSDYYAIPAFKGTNFDVVSVSSFGGSLTVLMLVAGSTLPKPFIERFFCCVEGTFEEAARSLLQPTSTDFEDPGGHSPGRVELPL